MDTVHVAARPESLTIDPRTTAVIVVDMQQGFGGHGGWWDRAGVTLAGIQAVVRPIAQVLETARERGIRVVYLTMDLEGAGDWTSPRLDHYYANVGSGSRLHDPDHAALPAGVHESDILPELAPHDDELVVVKPRHSGFYNTSLHEMLQTWGITTLIFTGCTTSVCVESTLRDAAFRDYDCLLLRDCVAEPIGAHLQRTNHEATLLQVELLWGWVSDAEILREALRPMSASVVTT